MFRRRRPLKNESIQFSFDSFLDLVTNVVGIIIRLILVTWVGARSYHASMQWLDVEPEKKTTPVPKITDDPLHARLQQAKNDLDDAKTLLLARLKELDGVQQQNQHAQLQLAEVTKRAEALETQRRKLTGKFDAGQIQQVSLSIEQIRRRSKQLLDDIKKIDAMPSLKKELKYHAPVSKLVQSEELFFECKNGRVCYIDLPTLMLDIKIAMDDISQELKNTWRVERTTASQGPYRLRFAIERERTATDAGPTPPPDRGFRYGLSEWVVEPIADRRGETLEQALAAKSEFRQYTDQLDKRITTVTFWVYPDSFEVFRTLRDRLYERGIEVAGRPLTADAPIAASRNGSASRGQ